MSKFSLMDRIVGGCMAANVVMSTYNLYQHPSALTAIAAYAAVGPALLGNRIVDGWWLRVHTKGSIALFLREMILWPITLVDYINFKRHFLKAKRIIEAAPCDDKGFKTLKPDDYEYVVMVRTKYIDFLQTGEKMRSE